MADELEFKSLLSNLLKARFPYIYIPTWEEDRVLSVINTISTDPNLIKTPRTVYIWKLTTGLNKNGKNVSSDTKSPLKALEYIEKSDDPAIFVFLDFHIYLGS